MMQTKPGSTIRPFRVEIPQADLDELDNRLRRTMWPDELRGVGDAYGVPHARVRELAEYWLQEFDWRRLESRLNALPQFKTEIDGEDIHFLHVKSSRADATPMMLTHGWPGTVVEYLNAIQPLTEPSSSDAPAFHLVIPSLPGYGFSGPTRDTGWNRYRIAAAWVELMRRLGYDRYIAAGNDAGSMISPEMGRLAPEHVMGVHVTQLFSFPTGNPDEFVGLSDADQAAVKHLQWFYSTMFSFNSLHSQQPQTLAFALADSPVGLLAWNAQLFGYSLDPEFIIANVAIYWFTRTAGSAIRLYYEDARSGSQSTDPTTVPTGVAMFAGDFQSIRRFAERDHANIVSWNAYRPDLPIRSGRDAAGHYAAHQSTHLLVHDIRNFASRVRALAADAAIPDVGQPART
jgi:pimeloyl-ACP methyl ester carboxylesterase